MTRLRIRLAGLVFATLFGLGFATPDGTLTPPASAEQPESSPVAHTTLQVAQLGLGTIPRTRQTRHRSRRASSGGSGSGSGKQSYEKADEILTDDVPEVRGPKRIVAVGQADAIGAYQAETGPWDVGGGIAAMLTDALKESGRFIVVERAQIAQILAEQELGGQQLLHQGSGPQMGKIIGAEWFLHLSITEFGMQDSGGGVSVGYSGRVNNRLFGNRLLGGGVSPQWANGKVAMDTRVVSAEDSEVKHTITVEEKITKRGFDMNVAVEEVSFGGNHFSKSPLGAATRRMVTRTVQRLAEILDKEPWTGRVVEVDTGEVYINAGKESGVKVGDRFNVTRVTKTFTDPQTGRLLGRRTSELGTVEITGVEEKLAYGFFVPFSAEEPQRGDWVVLPAPPAEKSGE